ncbi:Uncharacterised protein [Yersinia massiliensis]|nr:Uncharacterised protein [Yersinia massiliensis]
MKTKKREHDELVDFYQLIDTASSKPSEDG